MDQRDEDECDDAVNAVEHIADLCSALIAGREWPQQAAIVLDLHSRLLSVVPKRRRTFLLLDHCKAVLQLAEVQANLRDVEGKNH